MRYFVHRNKSLVSMSSYHVIGSLIIIHLKINLTIPFSNPKDEAIGYYNCSRVSNFDLQPI